MKQVYPRVEKVSASSFSSRGLFFSSSVARSDNCPISEKKSPLSEKEVWPWPFPLGDILVSGPTEHLFWSLGQCCHRLGKIGLKTENAKTQAVSQLIKNFFEGAHWDTKRY